MSLFLEQLEHPKSAGIFSDKIVTILQSFYVSYSKALQKAGVDHFEQLLITFLELLRQQQQQPHQFALYNQQQLVPFDFHRFGLDMIRPLIDWKNSVLLHRSRFDQINAQLANRENVILLANHQTELDPQLIDLMLEQSHPLLAREMIFIAGHRVISDPLAIPFSLGRNLICIYSKKHMDHPSDAKMHKQLHNQRSLASLSSLLAEGSKCIYVAPSGGRDRKNSAGALEVAPFDSQSVEMMYLLAAKAQKPCHFYTLALKTYDILPPPLTVEVDLGEWRSVNYAPVCLCLSKEIENKTKSQPSHFSDKQAMRKQKSDAIWQQLYASYQEIEKITLKNL